MQWEEGCHMRWRAQARSSRASTARWSARRHASRPRGAPAGGSGDGVQPFARPLALTPGRHTYAPQAALYWHGPGATSDPWSTPPRRRGLVKPPSSEVPGRPLPLRLPSASCSSTWRGPAQLSGSSSAGKLLVSSKPALNRSSLAPELQWWRRGAERRQRVRLIGV